MDRARNIEVKNLVLEQANIIDPGTLVAGAIQAEVSNVLKLNDLETREQERLFKDPVKLGEAKQKIVDVMTTDPDCVGMTFSTADSLLELMEKYIFTTEYFAHPHSYPHPKAHEYIRERFVYLATELDLDFPNAIASIMKYHVTKLLIRERGVFEDIGVPMSSLSSLSFLNSGDHQYTLNRLTLNNAIKYAQNETFKEVSDTFQKDIKDVLDNLPVGANPSLPMHELAKKVRTIVTNTTEAYEKEAKRLQQEKVRYAHDQGYDVDPTKEKDTVYKDLEARHGTFEKKLRKCNAIKSMVVDPVLTFHDINATVPAYAGVISGPIVRNGLDKPNLENLIGPKVQQFSNEVIDEYTKELFGTSMSAAQEKVKKGLGKRLTNDSLNPHISNAHLNKIKEAEKYIKIETGKDISLHPGAWYKIYDDINKKSHFYKIKDVANGNVLLEPNGYPIPLKSFIEYLKDPAYGEKNGEKLTLTFVYDGHKKPLKKIKDLEKALGLGGKGKAIIGPGVLLTSYDTVNEKTIIHDEIAGVTSRSIILKGKGDEPSREVSFEEFYILAKENNWKIESAKNEFNKIEDLRPAHDGGIIFTSVADLWRSGKAKVKALYGKVKKKWEITALVSAVNGEKIGSDEWKEKIGALMKKEKEEVESKVKELKEEHPKGGNKRDGLMKFMSNPPDIRDFHGRVLAKAWLQITLSSFGTLYPSDNFKDHERNRFWIRLFSTGLGVKDKVKFANPYAEAIDNAVKATNGTETDARVEFKTLIAMISQGKYTNPSLAGAMGKGYSGELTGFQKEGSDNLSKDKEEAIKKATIHEIYKIVSESIQNQEWDTIKLVFEKLAGKGFKPDVMFHLFMYLVDQLHYVEDGMHRSKMPISDLNGIGKALSGLYPVPYFALLAKESSFLFFCKMIYENPYIKDTLGWKSGAWDDAQVGPFKYKVPKGKNAKDLHKFFLATGGNYEILRGISEDTKDPAQRQYAPEEKDYAEYRGVIKGLMDNLRGERMKISENIDKNSWSYSPLLNMDLNYFSKLYNAREPLVNGKWDTSEAQIFFTKLLEEYKKAQSSNLPAADKQALKMKLGEFIWEGFWSTFKYGLTNGSNNNQNGRKVRLSDANRDRFVQDYGETLTSFGLDFQSSYMLFSKDENKNSIEHPTYTYIDNNRNKPMKAYG